MSTAPSGADASPPSPPPPSPSGWQAFRASVMGLFHQYANWLVSISWKRFFVLSVLLLLVAVILQHLPPFSYTVGSVASSSHPVAGIPPVPPVRRCHRLPPVPRANEPTIKIEKKGDKGDDVVISIDRDGVRISPHVQIDRNGVRIGPGASASGASAASSAGPAASIAADGIEIRLPPGADSEAVREAVKEAREAVVEAIRESQKEIAEAAREAARKPPRALRRSLRRACRRARRRGDRRPHRQAHARPQVRRLPDRSGVAGDLLLGDPEDRLQAHHPGRGQGRGRDRDRRLGAAQAPGRRGAHGGDAGPGRAALPVQHAGLDRPPDRDRPAAREHDAEEPDRAAQGVDAVDARVEPCAAQPRPRDGGDPALSRDPEGADGRPAADRASWSPRACSRPSSRR